MSKNDGGPAFPVVMWEPDTKGMSLRDWFAGQALAGLVVNWTRPSINEKAPHGYPTMAYRLADDMLKEREQ